MPIVVSLCMRVLSIVFLEECLAITVFANLGTFIRLSTIRGSKYTFKKHNVLIESVSSKAVQLV